MSSALRRYAHKNILQNKNQNRAHQNKAKSREQSIMTKMTNMSKNRKKTIPSDSDTISYDERNGSYDYNSRKRMNSLPIALPKLSQQIVLKQKQAINHIYKKRLDSKKHYQLHPLRKFQPIRLMNRPSSSNSQASYLSMASSRAKITDQYFSQLDNIRMVEKLLLAGPSKQTSKSQHKQFFKKQQKYRKNIQFNKMPQTKVKKLKFINKPWNS